jgi:hypothetical protein
LVVGSGLQVAGRASFEKEVLRAFAHTFGHNPHLGNFWSFFSKYCTIKKQYSVEPAEIIAKKGP